MFSQDDKAVAKAIRVINRVLPTRDQSIRIVKQMEERLIEVEVKKALEEAARKAEADEGGGEPEKKEGEE